MYTYLVEHGIQSTQTDYILLYKCKSEFMFRTNNQENLEGGTYDESGENQTSELA